MKKLNASVDEYFTAGCGRCSLFNTPACKVHLWTQPLQKLRKIAVGSGLTEVRKWGVPCYTDGPNNVLLIGAFKAYCALSFFKGVLMKDPEAILEKPGENSQSGRLIRFTSLQTVIEKESILKDYIREAIEIERAGLKVDFKAKHELEIPDELQQRFLELPALRLAFESLTPGRQRGYVLHINAAKQSKTRLARVDKCIPRILEGLGMHD